MKNFSRSYGKMLVRKIEEAHGHAKHTQDQPLSGEHASRATVIDRGVFVRRCARDHAQTALFQPGILNAQSLKTMFASQKTTSGEETGYGIGWGIAKSSSGKPIYEHSGGSVGGHSQLIIYPGSHVVVALVTNLSGADWKRSEVEAPAEKFESPPK